MSHELALSILKTSIEDIKGTIEYLKRDGVKRNATSIAKFNNNIEDITGTIAIVTTLINQPFKVKNNNLRLKIFKNKNKEVVDVNVIKKEGKEYAIVPLEILPDTIIF